MKKSSFCPVQPLLISETIAEKALLYFIFTRGIFTVSAATGPAPMQMANLQLRNNLLQKFFITLIRSPMISGRKNPQFTIIQTAADPL